MTSPIAPPHSRPAASPLVTTTLFCVIASACALQAPAQSCGSDAQSAIATDRPQVTNSSAVVPCGSLQFENGLQVTGTGDQRSPDFPETSIRYGITAKTELRFSTPNYLRNDAVASGTDGWSDVSLGVKQQLAPLFGFASSLIPFVSLPTGSKSISSHGYDPGLQLPWSRSLTKAWTGAGQFGATWPTQSGRRIATGETSLYIDRQLTSPWDAYVEYSAIFPRHGSPQQSIDLGTAYKPSPHQQLDLHCGFGLSSAAPDYSVGFGYSVRFQIIRSK